MRGGPLGEEAAAFDPVDRPVEEGEEEAEHGVDADRAEDRPRPDFRGGDDADQDRARRDRQQDDLDQRADAEPGALAGDGGDDGQRDRQQREPDRRPHHAGVRVRAGQRDHRGGAGGDDQQHPRPAAGSRAARRARRSSGPAAAPGRTRR